MITSLTIASYVLVIMDVDWPVSEPRPRFQWAYNCRFYYMGAISLEVGNRKLFTNITSTYVCLSKNSQKKKIKKYYNEHWTFIILGTFNIIYNLFNLCGKAENITINSKITYVYYEMMISHVLMHDVDCI